MAARDRALRLSRPVAVALVLLVPLSACLRDSAQVVGFERTPPLRVGSYELPEVTTDRAQRFRFRARPGHLLVAYFGYTSCPDVCPTTLADVRDALAQLGEERTRRIDLAMTTVDPERDTPPVLRGYLGSFFGVGRAHALRTVDRSALARVEEAFLATSSVTEAPDGTVEVSHSGTIYGVDPDGRVVVEWPFGTQPDDLASDLRLLLSRVDGNPR